MQLEFLDVIATSSLCFIGWVHVKCLSWNWLCTLGISQNSTEGGYSKTMTLGHLWELHLWLFGWHCSRKDLRDETYKSWSFAYQEPRLTWVNQLGLSRLQSKSNHPQNTKGLQHIQLGKWYVTFWISFVVWMACFRKLINMVQLLALQFLCPSSEN